MNGWGCIDQLTIVGLTGTVTTGNVSLTSTSVNGQVVTFTGSITNKVGAGPYTFSGTYVINGGCADGDQGSITGSTVDSISDHWAGNFTTATGGNIHVNAQLAQDNASFEGSFGLGGTATFDDVCFRSGVITPGIFPSASFIIGSSVVLDIKTNNGTIAFLGRADPDGLIRGSYTVAASSCEPSGTGYLSPWEY